MNLLVRNIIEEAVAGAQKRVSQALNQPVIVGPNGYGKEKKIRKGRILEPVGAWGPIGCKENTGKRTK